MPSGDNPRWTGGQKASERQARLGAPSPTSQPRKGLQETAEGGGGAPGLQVRGGGQDEDPEPDTAQAPTSREQTPSSPSRAPGTRLSFRKPGGADRAKQGGAESSGVQRALRAPDPAPGAGLDGARRGVALLVSPAPSWRRSPSTTVSPSTRGGAAAVQSPSGHSSGSLHPAGAV